MPLRRFDVHENSFVPTRDNVDGTRSTSGFQTRSRVTAFDYPRRSQPIPANRTFESDIYTQSPQENATNVEFYRSINMSTQLVAS